MKRRNRPRATEKCKVSAMWIQRGRSVWEICPPNCTRSSTPPLIRIWRMALRLRAAAQQKQAHILPLLCDLDEGPGEHVHAVARFPGTVAEKDDGAGAVDRWRLWTKSLEVDAPWKDNGPVGLHPVRNGFRARHLRIAGEESSCASEYNASPSATSHYAPHLASSQNPTTWSGSGENRIGRPGMRRSGSAPHGSGRV